jgi:hypothetical protein
MTRPQSEQLQSLDNFQRTEFLRMQRSQISYSAKIAKLRTKTSALYRKQQAGEFRKLESVFSTLTVIAVITSLSLLVFDFSFFIKQIGMLLLALMSPGIFAVSMRLLANQDEMLYESYVLEINRYQAELDSMGLMDYYSQDHDRTRDILSSLGFDNGLIGGTLDMGPLEAAE